ncbi:GGDEF domain-containing protein [Zavarzinia sp. CC-PAN008]|uniref:GGDEF domain-containing protein n=1 Tax=Zavarzinia sp. CC-PAN008 TaxID=3243332 RepID=UPI003F7460EF
MSAAPRLLEDLLAPASPAPDVPSQSYSLFEAEERILAEAEAMIERLERVQGGVRAFSDAFRQSFREQQRLIRLSDRMQRDLQVANRRLAEQAHDLRVLNTKLECEIEQRGELEAELRRQASIDVLTGALTRRRLLELAAHELRRSARTGRPLGLLLLDVDHFKAVNDRFGHAAGDAALQHLTRVCQAGLRDGDVFGRMGGEEFAVLLPETGMEQALEIAERLRRTAEVEPLVRDGHAIELTLSIGVTVAESGETMLDQALSRADEALYRAKSDGRNTARRSLMGAT